MAEEVLSRYEKYLKAIGEYNPEAPVRHQKVVEGLRACAANLHVTVKDPIERMVTQIECSRGMKGLRTAEEIDAYVKKVLKEKKK